MANPFEENFNRRKLRLERRLRSCPAPLSTSETNIQDIVPKIMNEFNWDKQSPFPIPKNDNQSANAMKQREMVREDQTSIREILKGQLPSWNNLFFDGCFQKPTYHWGILSDLARLYEFWEITPLQWTTLHLRESDKNDQKLLEIIWISEFLDMPGDAILALISHYKNTFVEASQLPKQMSPPTLNGNAQSQSGQIEIHQKDPNGPIHVSTNATNNKNFNYNSDQHMDPRTLLSVIQTVSNIKFSGSLDESINLTLTLFNLACHKFCVPESEKVDLLTYALTGPARTHFLSNMGNINGFSDAEALLKATYNCASRQLQVVRKLEQLRYRKFTTEKGITDTCEGLKALVEHIEMLIPMTPTTYHHEDHKISFLKKAVIDQPWAKLPVKNINALQFNFASFVTALNDSIQGDKELESARLEGEAESMINFTNQAENNSNNDDSTDVVETLLGYLARHPKHFKRRNNMGQQYGKSNPCRRCGAQWSPGHRCTPGSIRTQVRDRIGRGENHVHIISDLLKSIEEPDNASSNDQNSQQNETATHLAEFDQVMKSDGPTPNDETDNQYYTAHISSIMNAESPAHDSHYLGFQKGVDY